MGRQEHHKDAQQKDTTINQIKMNTQNHMVMHKKRTQQ